MINLVQDRVTGELYDPMVEFEKLLHHAIKWLNWSV